MSLCSIIVLLSLFFFLAKLALGGSIIIRLRSKICLPSKLQNFPMREFMFHHPLAGHVTSCTRHLSSLTPATSVSLLFLIWSQNSLSCSSLWLVFSHYSIFFRTNRRMNILYSNIVHIHKYKCCYSWSLCMRY